MHVSEQTSWACSLRWVCERLIESAMIYAVKAGQPASWITTRNAWLIHERRRCLALTPKGLNLREGDNVPMAETRTNASNGSVLSDESSHRAKAHALSGAGPHEFLPYQLQMVA